MYPTANGLSYLWCSIQHCSKRDIVGNNQRVGLQVPQVMLSLTPYPRCRAPCRTSSRSRRMPTLSRATPSSCAVELHPPYRSSSNAMGSGCIRTSTSPKNIRTSTPVRQSFCCLSELTFTHLWKST